MKDELDSGPRHLGFIAQEVEPLFPELVSNTGEFKGISYPEFAPVAIAALQELSAQTKSLRTENEALKQQLTARDFKELARDERLAALEGLVKKLAQAGGNDRRAENIAPAKAAQEPGASGATTFAADR